MHQKILLDNSIFTFEKRLYRLDGKWSYLMWFNPLSANPTKWNCLSEFDRFVRLVLEGLSNLQVEVHICTKNHDHMMYGSYDME